MEKRNVAFFDVDGTLFRSSLLIEVVNALIDKKIFPQEARYLYERAYENWLNREGSYENYIEAVITSYLTHLKGVHYGDFADVAREVVKKQEKRVYRYTRDLINDLKSKGYFIVAVSQSPKTILDEFCSSYGFDKVYGRIYEIGPTDRFTGIVTGSEIIEDKSKIVDRVFDKEEVKYEGSVGVGDTDGDIPLLSRVEMPICFNPNKGLYLYAKQKKWPIVVERKDVVYTI